MSNFDKMLDRKIERQQNDSAQTDNAYFRSEVMRIAREMLDTTHGLTLTQKDRYAEYLISLAYTHDPSPSTQEQESQQGEVCSECEGFGEVGGYNSVLYECTKCNGTGREDS